MAKIRTFIAVNLSAKIRKNAGHLINKMMATRADYKWVPEENLHITLNFVGDVPEFEVADLCRDIDRRVTGMESFALTVMGIGGFPTLEEPRTLWLGVTEGHSELAAINEAIGEVLEEWRFPKDRQEFHPHVTIGRLKRGGRWNRALLDLIAADADHQAGSCGVNEVVVYSSYLDKVGPTHTPMTRVKLR
jgi:2'-5' RNA ligase